MARWNEREADQPPFAQTAVARLAADLEILEAVFVAADPERAIAMAVHERVEALLDRVKPPLYLTPVTQQRRLAAEWLKQFEGAGLDGVIVKAVDSPRVKLLYDIYHMQIMEGDVIRTIRDNHQYIAHYHTAGVPGRHEIDASQELNYPAIMRAIADTGFKGFVAQEFIPTRDPRTSLDEAVKICRV